MKEATSHTSLNSLEIHAPTFDCDIDSGSVRTNHAHQDLPLRPDSKLHTELESDQYKQPLPISDRLPPDCILPVPFIHTPETSRETGQNT